MLLRRKIMGNSSDMSKTRGISGSHQCGKRDFRYRKFPKEKLWFIFLFQRCKPQPQYLSP